jgi:hypothetical protein
MAGDWIKVEHATIDKPEVALFSELLGVPVPQGFGLLVMFWMWCDRHSRNGFVTQASRMSIDTVTHTPGFSTALEAVGWGSFDDATRVLTLPNFVRHNESSAKTRALSNDRVKRFRNADTVTKPLPEKRREEKSISTKSKASAARTRARPLPENFGISEGVKTWAATKGHAKLEERLEHFVCKAKAKDYRYVDWDAAFKSAIRDDWAGLSTKAQVNGSSPSDKRAAVARAIFGEKNERPDDITGKSTRLA